MDPNAVLTEEQRQIRFRKANERKIVDQNRRSSGNRSEASPDDEAGRLQRPSRSTLFPPLALEQQQQQQQQHQQLEVQQLQQYDDDMRLNKWAKILQPKVEMIVQNYRKLKVSISSTFYAHAFLYKSDFRSFSLVKFLSL
jgi:hypothetical protein